MAQVKRSSTLQAKLGPRLADLYALLIGVFGVLVLIRLLDYQTMSFDLSTLLPFTLFALLVSYFRIPIGQSDAELRLDGAVLLGAALMAGPVIGGWAAFVTGLVTGMLPLPHKRLVRSSLMDHIVTGSLDGGRNVIAVGAAWTAYYSLGGILKPSRITLGLGIALTLLCLSYVLIRSMLEWPFPLLKGANPQSVLLEAGSVGKFLIEFIPLPIALLIWPAFVQFGWVRVLILALVLVGSGALMHRMDETIYSLQNQIGTMRLSNRIKHALSSTSQNTQALCDLARQFCAEIVAAECEVGLYNRDRTQVMVQGSLDGSHSSMMRIPITPFWDWISRQQEPILFETRAQLDELELLRPTFESEQQPQSILVVPILVQATEREKDWDQLRGDVPTEDGIGQDNAVAGLSEVGNASDGSEREDAARQEHHAVGAFVLHSPFVNAFGKPSLERIQVLVRLIGEAMQHARLLAAYNMQDADQRIARQIQSDLLRQETPPLPNWDIAVRWDLSAQAKNVCSGFFRPAERDKFVLIEPLGHGLAAATAGLLIHTLIRVNDAQAMMSEIEAVEAMNAYLMTTNQPTALLCASLDRENILTLINAGCASPLWWHNEHNHVEDLRSTGSALGLTVDAVYEEKSIALAINDALVLCTSSLLSVSDGKEVFGQKRLIQALNQCGGCSASELAAAIMAQVADFGNCLPSLRQDDILVAVFRRKDNRSDEPGRTDKQDSLAEQERNKTQEDANNQDA